MTNPTLRTLEERRSIRKYKAVQVEEEALEAILRAGTFAATGRNLQSPIILVLQDKDTIEQLRRMNAEIMGDPDLDPFYGAPTVVVVLADKKVRTCIEDGSLVIGNMMNAAYSVGVDSCWIHRAREEFESDEGKALLAKWGIEGDYVGIGHLILGYRDCEYPEKRPRKDNYVYRV
jgi:nitroreductase